ncbi:MAG: gliding motility-associated C-terminal domain-containing protein [Algibacter sp.]|uniref:gliding motility-associated C-terminal domain-containing protein n=1 Tax=Algibacter sp. TaxID=1872428 RepID=UPI00329975C3
MKTKPTQKISLPYAFFFLLLFGMSNLGFSQCPTISNPTPPPICDAGGYSFSDLNAYASDGGDGIVWYDAPTGGNAFNVNELVDEGIYYADNNSRDCASRVAITIDFVVDASGQNLDRVYCSNEGATYQVYIDDVLSSSIPINGSAEIYTDIALTNSVSASDEIPSNMVNHYILFVDNSGCKSQIESARIVVSSSPSDATPPTSQPFCSDAGATVADLDPGTTGNYYWYENLDGSGDPILPSLSSTEILENGTYYIQVDNFICVSDPVAVSVSIDDPVNPGIPNSLAFCNDSLPASDFNLFDELGGPKDTTGAWTGPRATGNGYLGTINISSLTTPGDYIFTYTVPSNGVCPDGISAVTISVYESLSSGNPSAANPASFCIADLPIDFDLFSLIENYDIDGQWTEGSTSSDPIVTSPIDLSGLTEGTYNYTYTQNVSPNPCPENSTTVQIVVLEDPNAGVALNAVFCENDLTANSPYNLFDALDGSQDNNSGTWRDSNSNTISNNLNITTLTVEGSPYFFNYTIDNGTCSDTEIITITIEPAPESGTVNTPAAFCEGAGSSSFDLFTLLDGEDQTGTWSDDDATGAVTGNVVDLSGLTPATYNFTFDVDAIGSCDDELVTVQITINPLPNTGVPMAATFCENDLVANSPLDLFGQLTGEDAGGTWTDDNSSGALTSSNVDLTALVIGSYNFTYTISDANGCENSSTVTVIVTDAPESGTINTPAAFCISEITSGETYNLFELLEGEDQTGTWSDDNASGALSGNLVTIDGLPSGTYNFTFDVDAIGSCDDELVTVSIVINDIEAPLADATQEFCDSATISSLVATGTTIKWYDEATAGNLLTNDTALVDGQMYYASQTDATTGCESSERTAVAAIIYQSPNAGGPNETPLVSCNTNLIIDLFTGLDGTQDNSGTWYNDDGVGILIDNLFTTLAVPPGAYNFTYVVSASSPCVDDSETITITIEEPLNAGSNINPSQVMCSNEGTVDLFTLLGGADEGGTWSPALTSGTGVFDPLVDVDGTYVYTLTNSCGTFTNQVEVEVTLAPNAGENNTLDICANAESIDLFTLLGTGAQSGGLWSPELTSTTGVFDPSVDTSGTYTYTVTAVSPCSPDATAEITVTVSDTPAVIVLDSDPEFCLQDDPTVADLSVSIRPTGTVNWYDDIALTIPLLETDSLIDGEDYYVTQTSNGCESLGIEQINVTINDAPTPTLKDSTIEYCINDNPNIAILSDNISEYENEEDNLRWYDTATGGSAISSSSSLTTTTYFAALVDAVTGCESSVRLQVTPDLTACGILQIPDGFSPNGDGTNDTFDVDNLAILYPNFEIEIFNRNGNVVYKGNANTPRFDGTSNQGRIVSKGDLPVGVYFYIFNYNDGENKPEQGRLYLSR